MKRTRANLCAALAVLLALSVLTVFTLPTTAAAAARLSLNTTSKTLYVGAFYKDFGGRSEIFLDGEKFQRFGDHEAVYFVYCA